MEIDEVNDINTVIIVPKPKKYGQYVSMYVKRLCSSQPILHHLYSNAYNEYSKHKWSLDIKLIQETGIRSIAILWNRNIVCVSRENIVSAIKTPTLNDASGWPLRTLYAESAISYRNVRKEDRKKKKHVNFIRFHLRSHSWNIRKSKWSMPILKL